MKTAFTTILIATVLSTAAQESIYYSSEQNTSGRDIYVLDPESGKSNRLTRKLGSGHYPHFINPKLTPDGSKLVFQADTDGHDRYAIWTMNIDGTAMKRITTDEGMYPNWSPDGTSIIYSGRRNGVWEILMIPADGGNEKNLSNNKENGKRPGWGATCSIHPNGKSFVFTHIREKVLYSFDFETGQVQQLTTTGSYLHPVYSKDGTSILVNRKLDETYDMVIIKDGKEEVVAESIISYSAPDWFDNDSKVLFVGSVNGVQQLFSKDLMTGEEIQLTDNKDFNGMPVAY